MSTPTTQSDTTKLNVRVESHCIGCSTCVQVCGDVFALSDGTLDDQKSYIKEDANLSSDNEANIDTAVQMCPVTAIFKD